MDISQVIKNVPLFRGLTSDQISVLAQSARRRTYAPGAAIAYRGDPGGAMYVIVSGKLKVHSATENGIEVILAVMGEGECVGELSLIDGKPRSADITAWEKTECVIIDQDALLHTIKASSEVALSMMRVLCERVRNSSSAIESLASQDVISRVAELLARLSVEHGDPTVLKDCPNARILRLDLTQADIASFVGATRERVNQAMGVLKKAKLIVLDPKTKRICVPEPTKLATFAQER